jgi:hypothetical protein
VKNSVAKHAHFFSSGFIEVQKANLKAALETGSKHLFL